MSERKTYIVSFETKTRRVQKRNLLSQAKLSTSSRCLSREAAGWGWEGLRYFLGRNLGKPRVIFQERERSIIYSAFRNSLLKRARKYCTQHFKLYYLILFSAGASITMCKRKKTISIRKHNLSFARDKGRRGGRDSSEIQKEPNLAESRATRREMNSSGRVCALSHDVRINKERRRNIIFRSRDPHGRLARCA